MDSNHILSQIMANEYRMFLAWVVLIPNGYKYIAVDSSGSVFAYQSEPVRSIRGDYWISGEDALKPGQCILELQNAAFHVDYAKYREWVDSHWKTVIEVDSLPLVTF